MSSCQTKEVDSYTTSFGTVVDTAKKICTVSISRDGAGRIGFLKIYSVAYKQVDGAEMSSELTDIVSMSMDVSSEDAQQIQALCDKVALEMIESV